MAFVEADIAYVIKDVTMRTSALERAVVGGEMCGRRFDDLDAMNGVENRLETSCLNRLKNVHETIVGYERIVEGFQSMIKEYERTLKSFKAAALGGMGSAPDIGSQTKEDADEKNEESLALAASLVAEREKVDELSRQLASLADLEKYANQPYMRDVAVEYTPRVASVEASTASNAAAATRLHGIIERNLHEYAAAMADTSQQLVEWSNLLEEAK